jgi:hypothetical protein
MGCDEGGPKNKVWETFGSVFLSDDTVTDYVVCFECEMLYKVFFSFSRVGFGSLSAHIFAGWAGQFRSPNGLGWAGVKKT